MKYLLTTAATLFLLSSAAFAQTEGNIKTWLEQNGPGLFSNDPQTFKERLETIKPMFTQDGFIEYKKALEMSRRDAASIRVETFCVSDVTPHGSLKDAWVAHSYLLIKRDRPRLGTRSEADFLVSPAKKISSYNPPDASRNYNLEEAKIVVVHDNNASNPYGLSIIQYVGLSSSFGPDVPERCSPRLSKEEEQNYIREQKEKLQKDLQDLNRREEELKGAQ